MKTSKTSILALLAAAAAFTACDDDKQYTLNAPETKLLEEITFDVSDVLPLAVGMDSTLVYTFGPEDCDDTSIVFTSSDEDIATVDQDGTIHALKVGQATISALPSLGFPVYNAQATVIVEVIPEVIKISSIEIVNTTPVSEDGKIYVTDELQLQANILPEDATYKRLIWSSTNEAVATVDKDGKVVCTGEGDATIIAASTDRSGVRGEFKIHVDKYIAAEKIAIKPLDGPVCISYGSFALEVTYEPTGATVGSVEWSSDDESVATVRRGIVSPTGFGNCNITATCVETGFSASVSVTVEPGLYIWDKNTMWNGWICSDGEKPNTSGDKGTWRVNFPAAQPGGKYRRDIKFDCNANNPIELRLKSYPVLAIRMTKLNGGNSTGDIVELNHGNAGNPNPKNGIDLGDGTQLLIYNLGSRPNFKDLDQALFRVFQLKIADIPYDNVDASKAYYDVYWARTFKSEDDAKNFANEQVARGE